MESQKRNNRLREKRHTAIRYVPIYDEGRNVRFARKQKSRLTSRFLRIRAVGRASLR